MSVPSSFTLTKLQNLAKENKIKILKKGKTKKINKTRKELYDELKKNDVKLEKIKKVVLKKDSAKKTSIKSKHSTLSSKASILTSLEKFIKEWGPQEMEFIKIDYPKFAKFIFKRLISYVHKKFSKKEEIEWVYEDLQLIIFYGASEFYDENGGYYTFVEFKYESMHRSNMKFVMNDFFEIYKKIKKLVSLETSKSEKSKRKMKL